MIVNVFKFSMTNFFLFLLFQNLTQCESACETNKKKRKVNEAFKCNYLYNIVSTGEGFALVMYYYERLLLLTYMLGMNWYFIKYTTEEIYCTSKAEYQPY